MDNMNNGARMNPPTGGGAPCRGNCDAMMKKLRAIDFAIVDVNLYLDAYPSSCSALEYYHKLLAERRRLAEAINAQCGPLTARDNVSTDCWKWTNGPWPWQSDAN